MLLYPWLWPLKNAPIENQSLTVKCEVKFEKHFIFDFLTPLSLSPFLFISSPWHRNDRWRKCCWNGAVGRAKNRCSGRLLVGHRMYRVGWGCRPSQFLSMPCCSTVGEERWKVKKWRSRFIPFPDIQWLLGGLFRRRYWQSITYSEVWSQFWKTFLFSTSHRYT